MTPGVSTFDGATAERFRAALTSENHTLKRALTDPRLLSGIGNAYSDEILHRARLSPVTLTSRLDLKDCARLHAACIAVLDEWIVRLGTERSGKFPEKVTAFRPEMTVHGRYGQPCPVCGTKVQRIRYASNETNYCPRCQTGGRLLADRSLSRLLKQDWPTLDRRARAFARRLAAMTRGWPRVVVHADMDAFYAAVEQRDDPALRGKPIIVGPNSPRGVVLTASYEARPYGVGSAMPMMRARKLCPEALIVPPHFERYQQASKIIMDLFATFSPHVEPLSLDEAFLDMTGTERLFGSPEDIGRRLKAAIREATGGLTASVGISATKYVAKVASGYRKPDGMTIVAPDEATAWLAPLPVSNGSGERGPRHKRACAPWGSRRSAKWPHARPRSWSECSDPRGGDFMRSRTRPIRAR